MSVKTVIEVPCNDKVYRIDLSNFWTETFDLEGNPVSFAEDKYEYYSLVDRIYHIFYAGLKDNLDREVLEDLDF